ncbi:MAG: AraC family transcriptional regulator, partial [Paraburkholderia tropica]
AGRGAWGGPTPPPPPRLFTRELGVGFAQWRRQVQLAIAVSRLAEGQSVSAVARLLGFLPSSFSDMFRRELGVPPSEYRPEDTLALGASASASADSNTPTDER